MISGLEKKNMSVFCLEFRLSRLYSLFLSGTGEKRQKEEKKLKKRSLVVLLEKKW